MKRNTLQDVWKYIDKRGEDECWNWTRGLSGGGYAQFALGRKLYQAHRAAYASVNPGGIELAAPKDRKAHGILMHTCDNRACCNPKHLIVATQMQNMRDAFSKKRMSTRDGVLNGRAVLNHERAAAIRARLIEGETRAQIARDFGVSWNCIDMVHRGERWSIV